MWGFQEQVGLTFSPTEIEVVTVRGLPGRRWRLQESRRVPLPERAFGAQGQIEDGAALLEALRSLFPNPSRFGPPVNVSFDGPLVLVRQSRLKEMPRPEQQAYLVDQTRRYPNFEDGELALGYSVIEETTGEGDGAEAVKELEVLAVATRQDLLGRLRELLEAAGLSMGMATSRALAAFGVPVRADRELLDQDKLWMAVTLVQAKLVISFWKGGRFMFYREVFLEKESAPGASSGRAARVAARAAAAAAPVRTSTLRELEQDLTDNLAELRQLTLAAPQPESVYEELARFLNASPVFNPEAPPRAPGPRVPIPQLIKEIKRSMSFHQVDDPAAVPVYLIDVPQANMVCERIQEQEPTLRAYPYRLDALPALRLGGRGPTAAALGPALLRSDSRSVIDMSFVKPFSSVRDAFVGAPMAAAAAGAILVGTTIFTYGFVERWTQAYVAEDAQVQQDTTHAKQTIRTLEESMPGQGAREQVRNMTARDRRMAASLARLINSGLRDAMPAGAWVEDFNLGEGGKFNMTGMATDNVAILDLTQQLKRITYVSGVRLLEVTESNGGNGPAFRFRIVGTLTPPEAGQG